MTLTQELELQDAYMRFCRNLRDGVDEALKNYKTREGVNNKADIFDIVFPGRTGMKRKVAAVLNNGELLEHADFEALYDLLIWKYGSDYVKNALSDDYEAYVKFHKIFVVTTLRADIYLPTNRREVTQLFHEMLDEKGQTLKSILSDYAEYISFIHFHTERHAASDQLVKAIKNSWVIARYLHDNRTSAPLLMSVSDEEFSIMLAEVARLGAWAAWTMGNLYVFERLRTLVDRAGRSSRTKVYVVLSGILDGHADVLTGASTKSLTNGYTKALTAFREMQDDRYPANRDDESVLHYNVAMTEIRRGATLESRISQIQNRTVESILSEFTHTNQYYENVSRFKKLTAECHALLNELKLGDADAKLNQMSALILHPDYGDKTISLATYNWYRGKWHTAMTGERVNQYLQAARASYRKLGHFARAREVEVDLGWRRPDQLLEPIV